VKNKFAREKFKWASRKKFFFTISFFSFLLFQIDLVKEAGDKRDIINGTKQQSDPHYPPQTSFRIAYLNCLFLSMLALVSKLSKSRRNINLSNWKRKKEIS
jgi:hypothetical protein